VRERVASGLPDGTDPQVFDVARRFALVAYAGELAAEWSILAWSEGEPERVACAPPQPRLNQAQ
jgi:putative DNA primase/helicase